jgi:hypothetical protein
LDCVEEKKSRRGTVEQRKTALSCSESQNCPFLFEIVNKQITTECSLTTHGCRGGKQVKNENG